MLHTIPQYLPRHNVKACFDITSGRLACSINIITFDAEHRRFTEQSELKVSFRKNYFSTNKKMVNFEYFIE